MRRHKLDVAPIPEKVLYINEPAIADRSIYDVCGTDEEINAPVTDEDNIRVYVPLDLNRKALLRRLNGLTKYGDLTTDSEMNYSCGVDGIITQVEIYDRIWYTAKMSFSRLLTPNITVSTSKSLSEKSSLCLRNGEQQARQIVFPMIR